MVFPWLMCRYVNHTAEVSSTSSSRSLNCFRIFFTGKRSILAQTSSGSRSVDSQNGSCRRLFGRCCASCLALLAGYFCTLRVNKQITRAVKRISPPRVHGVTAAPSASCPRIRMQTPLWRSCLTNAARLLAFPVRSGALEQTPRLEFPAAKRLRSCQVRLRV